MYDTMKDRRIGIPEVIEKFGVPPEKVVEVQALAGDSTDNVPGVPGIGIKTAAQLIIEYGDLEQLLFRAGEIKQPKRREALIENAEKARISRKLVLLDDKVELDVPLDELAVHEPDARKLIAFLKAMEFSTLTRRVAEYSADRSGRCRAGRRQQERRQRVSPLPPVEAVDRPPATCFSGRPRRSARRAQEVRATSRTSPRASRARRSRWPPRAAERDHENSDRSQEIPDHHAASIELNAFIARVHDVGHVAIEAKSNSIDPMQAEISGIALALAPNDAAYVPLGHKQSGGGAGLFDAGLAPDQIKAADALGALKPLLESQGILKIGFNIKFNAVMLAQPASPLRN